MTRARLGLALGASLSLAGCGDDTPFQPVLEVLPLKLQQVSWNAKKVSVGKIAAVAELYDDTVIFGSQGALVFTSGLLLAADNSATSWQGAAVIPAGDLSGEWIVGVDGKGLLRRLRNRSALEDISDRYGLRGTPVSEVASLGQGMVGFVVPAGLAVADGKEVIRYDLPFAGLSGGGGRAAAVADGAVHVFSPATKDRQDYQVPDPVAAVFDGEGRLVVAAQAALYRQGEDGALRKIYDSPDAQLRGLARSGPSVWVAIGDALALLDGDRLRKGDGGVVPVDARLLGSPGGDVWLLAGGALSRFAQDDGGGQDEDLWQRTVLPVFTRLCSVCHLPGGSASIDLSTYKAWAARRALVGQRVVQGKPTPMPPAGAGALTPAELEALKTWIASAG